MASAGLLSITELEPNQILTLLERAREYAGSAPGPATCTRRFVAFASERDSVRTRLATHQAALLLGLGYEDIRLESEFYADPARRPDHAEFVAAEFASLGQLGCAALVVRIHNDEILREWRALSILPVVNACSDGEHPLQALADVSALVEEFGDVTGLRLCLVGNGRLPVFRSLALVASRLQMHLTLVCPPGFELPDDVLALSALGSEPVHTQDLLAAISDADAVCADSIAYRAPTVEEASAFEPYRLSEATFEAAGSHARVMHCLPHSSEVTSELVLGDRSIAMRQVAWRTPITAAVLESLL